MLRINAFGWWTISFASALALSACGDGSSGDTSTGGAAGAKGNKGGATAAGGSLSEAGAPGPGGVPSTVSGGTGSGGTSGLGEGGIGGEFMEGGADNSGGLTGRGGVGVQPGGGAGGKANGGTAGKSAGGGAGKGGGGAGGSASGGSAGKGGTTGGTAGNSGAGGVSGAAGNANGGVSGSAGSNGGGGAGSGGITSGAGGTAGSAGSGGTGATGWQKSGNTAFVPTAAAIDPRDDSIWLAAKFKGSLSLGSATYTAASAGSWIVARYDSASGALLQSFQTMNDASTVDGATTATPTSMVVDETGALFIAGTGLIGDAKIPKSSGEQTIVWSNDSAGDADAVIAKLDSNGKHAFSFSFAAAAFDDTVPLHLGLGGGNLALAFRLSVPTLDKSKLGVGTTGSGTFSQANASSESSYVLVSAFSASTGAFKWATRFGTSGADQRPGCVEVDKNGDVFVAGQFDTSINFAPPDAAKALAVLVGGGGETDVFAAKLAGSNGAHQWSHAYSGDDANIELASTDVVGGCSTPRGGTDFAIWGSFDGAKLAMGSTDVPNPEIGALASYFAKLSSTGATSTARLMKGASSADVAASGDYVIAATVGAEGYDFGAGKLKGSVFATYSGAGTLDYAQAVFAESLNLQRVWTWFGAGGERALAVSYDPLQSATTPSIYLRVP